MGNYCETCRHSSLASALRCRFISRRNAPAVTPPSSPAVMSCLHLLGGARTRPSHVQVAGRHAATVSNHGTVRSGGLAGGGQAVCDRPGGGVEPVRHPDRAARLHCRALRRRGTVQQHPHRLRQVLLKPACAVVGGCRCLSLWLLLRQRSTPSLSAAAAYIQQHMCH